MTQNKVVSQLPMTMLRLIIPAADRYFSMGNIGRFTEQRPRYLPVLI